MNAYGLILILKSNGISIMVRLVLGLHHRHSRSSLTRAHPTFGYHQLIAHRSPAFCINGTTLVNRVPLKRMELNLQSNTALGHWKVSSVRYVYHL